ncbi:MAG: nucleotidyl transferase AbiEii/AbiGii toxin family protein [Microbacteriaceae bacterium]
MTSGYRSANSLRAAISEMSQRESATSGGRNRTVIETEFVFERFLSRIFSERDRSEWLLMGGTSMLARVPAARATKDIDLMRHDGTVDAAVDELTRLAAIDLGDFFTFRAVSRESAMTGGQQPYANGIRVVFQPSLGLAELARFKVDVSVRPAVIGSPIERVPANIHLLREPLQSHPYRMYPTVDQLAEKVCATMNRYGNGQTSSREKDLVDIVLLALTESIDATDLRRAIRAEAARRKLEVFNEFLVPPGWGRSYESQASGIPALSQYRRIGLAVELAQAFLNPVLSDDSLIAAWSPDSLRWLANAKPPTAR